MKTKLIRDVPIGVLMIVIAMWFFATMQYLAGWPNFLHTLGIFLTSVIGYRFFSVGMDVIVGIQIADKNDQK